MLIPTPLASCAPLSFGGLPPVAGALASIATACLAILLPASAWAEAGRLEINPACAIVGCFPGDDPGYPVTLAAAGSYVLTANLEVFSSVGGDLNGAVLEITAEDVTVDLAGFTISCRRPLLGGGGACSDGGGDGVGIRSTRPGTTVRNGTVRGMPEGGLVLDSRATLERVESVDNGDEGIRVSSGAHVKDATARSNASHGFVVGAISIVEGNVSRNNGGDGIRATAGSRVSGNLSASNAGQGFELGVASGTNFVVGGLFSDNVATTNAGLGFAFDPLWGYRDNSASNNNGGNSQPQVEGGVNLGGNLCGTGICP